LFLNTAYTSYHPKVSHGDVYHWLIHPLNDILNPIMPLSLEMHEIYE